MKKTIFLSLLLTLVSLSTMAMSRSKIRNHARFITDRMAYELDFTPMQYDDCYEINYDFIYAVAPIMDDAARGYYDAINAYYRYLDWRNDDLRYIMTASQYIRFMSKDYFYRPLYTRNFSWYFRIYTTYSNRSFFYYDAPTIFRDYRGGHSRLHVSTGYYTNRYPIYVNDRYTGSGNILGHNNFETHRKSDFGANLRERNQKPDYNNYGNRNADHRTSDSRYRDNSGNQNAPLINNRSASSSRGSSASSSSSRGSSTSASSSTSTRGSSGSTRGSASSSASSTSSRGTTSASSSAGSRGTSATSSATSTRGTSTSTSSSSSSTRGSSGSSRGR